MSSRVQPLFLLLLLVTTATDVKNIVHRLETRYHSARTLQATFLERYTENGRVLRTEAGIAYFRRPGKMRWEYQSPEKNLFPGDGKSARFQLPADHTVTPRPSEQSTGLRNSFALLSRRLQLSL